MRLRKPGPAVMIFVITSATLLASPVRGLTDARYTPPVGEALRRHGSFALDEWFVGRTNLSYQHGTRFRPTSACTGNGCGIGGTPGLLPGSCRRDSAAVFVRLARVVLRSGWP